MNRCKFALTMGGALAMGLAGVVNADESLRSEVDALRQQVAELKGQQNSNWLNERRAEEVKALIQEVLSDADTRASLMADGMGAGYDGRNFYVGSADGGFRLTISGQIQFRYIFNFENPDDGVNPHDRNDDGFALNRVKLTFGGHVTAGRKWDYEVTIAIADTTDGGDAVLDDAKFGTALSEAVRVDGGKFKLPFSREELISSRRMLAVERSIINEIFTLNRSEQIQLSYKSDQLLVRGSISDGITDGGEEFTPAGEDQVEIALTGRADFKVMGDWAQAADSSAWLGQPSALFVGAAVHFQSGDGKNGGDFNLFRWTVDALYKNNGLGVMAAVFGTHVNPDDDTDPNVEVYGAVLEVSYLLNDNVQPFIRGEWLGHFDDNDADTGVEECNYFVTAGLNYYFKGHDAKFTIDVLWLVDTVDAAAVATFGGNTIGFTEASTGEGDVKLRLQFQLLF